MSPGQSGRGFSVRVFLPGGDPEGLKVVEKSNWTGRGLVIPRPMFAESKAREELDRTGVYLLVGPGQSLPVLYVGQGDPVKPRLERHAKEKDFWSHAVVFTSTDANLNKAHVQHLEARLVELAQAAKRCTLENSNVPKAPSLSEADQEMAEVYLEDLLLCLPILGYPLFVAGIQAPAPTGILSLKSKRIIATGSETSGGFVVFRGSQAVGEEKVASSLHTSGSSYVADLRQELVRQGVLELSGELYLFTQDYTFASPSTAAAFVLGRSANGRIEWKDEKGRTLKELQEEGG